MKTKVSTLLTLVSLLQILTLVCGCAPLETTAQQPAGLLPPLQEEDTMKSLAEEQPALSPAETGIVDDASQLPVRYQSAGYMIEKSGFESAPGITSEEFSMPVGADISSTTGPISLRDILKRLAALKNMNIS